LDEVLKRDALLFENKAILNSDKLTAGQLLASYRS